MPSEKQSNVKQRAARIPLDYFQRQSALERGRKWLAIAAAAAALGYVAWSALGNSGVATRQASPGPLASVHAMWDNRCEVCHESFVPTSANAWSRDPHASDRLCQACHQGTDHSRNQIAAEVASCAACHHDHRGRDAELVRIADSACIDCHAQIAAHIKPGTNPIAPPLANVTSFVEKHPEFRSARRDPGELKFSHSRHMRPGLTLGRGPLLLSDLNAADRQRYRLTGQTDADAVKLNCASCHQLDRGTGAMTSRESDYAQTARTAGDYMLPIHYDLHCKACHPLNYVGKNRTLQTADSSTRPAADMPDDQVPHGLSDKQLRRYLEQVLAIRFLHSQDRALESKPLGEVLREPLDKWRLPNRPPQGSLQSQTVGEYLSGERSAAIKNLRTQCLECHQMTSQTEIVGEIATSPSLSVEPVKVHPAWFEHARFSHTSHRAVSCQSCHGGAYPGELPPEPTTIRTIDSGEVLIPGRKLCLQCHSPTEGSSATAIGGARFDCVECHRYHDGDHPWHGPGASAGAPRATVQQFIDGDMSKQRPSN